MAQLSYDLSGKVALVTGASYGLGAEFSAALAEAGADLILTARSAELLQQTKARVEAAGRQATVVAGDVSNEEDVLRVVQTGLAERGRIDVLVNNAGISDMRGLPSEQYDTATFRQIIEVDLIGCFVYAREVAKHMLERGSGSIINVCSIMAAGGMEINIPSYAAAKGGLLNLTRHLAVEWGDRGVRVNALSPGFIVTEMTRDALEGLGMTTMIASRTPARRVGEVDEVVGPMLFLASDHSTYCNGMNFTVDGGMEASRGANQIQPGHHHWNEKTHPAVGQRYEGMVPLPYEHWKLGIPGIHYPMPTGESGGADA